MSTKAWHTLEQRIRNAGPAALRRLESGYRKKLGRAGRDLEAAFALGRIALARGDLAAAEAALRQVVATDPSEPAFLLGLGEVLVERGRFVEAEPLLRAAAQGRAADPVAQFALARAWWGQGRPASAETALRRARALAPESTEILAELGRLLGARGRLDEARECLADALRKEPGSDTHLTVLDFLARLSGAASAAAYRDYLADHPDDVRAWYNLAFKAPETLAARERQTLEECLKRPGLPDAQAAAVAYALAALADRDDEFELAARWAREANRRMRRAQDARGRGYDAATHGARVTKILQVFDARWFERVQGWGHESQRPIFVVGMPRSGTTLVEQILASHSEVFGAGELAVINLSLERLPILTGDHDDPLDCVLSASQELITRSARYCLEAYKEQGDDEVRVTDKFPDNYLHLGWIHTLFPRALIVHCVRDPRAIAVSCWLNRLPQLLWSCDLEHITARLEEYARIMAHWHDVLPAGIVNVRYESLVADPESEARRLIAACNLEWQSACLRFHETERSVETASYRQVRRPVYVSSRERWRAYTDALSPVIDRLRAIRIESG